MTTINITENGQYKIAQYTEADVSILPITEQLEIVPTTSSQSFIPSGNIEGYSQVNVSAVSAEIDENILPENIKNGVEILGVTGNFEGPSFFPTQYEIDSEGQLKCYPQINFSNYSFDNITEISDYGLYYYYYNNGNGSVQITGNLNFSNLTTIGEHGMDYFIYINTIQNEAISIDFSSLSYVKAYGLHYTFGSSSTTIRFRINSIPDFSNLTKIDEYGLQNGFRSTEFLIPGIVSFPKLEIISDYALDCCFDTCIGITSVDFPKLECIKGRRSFYSTFYNTGLTSINFPALTTINGEDSSTSAPLNATFWGCVNLSSVSFPSLTTITGAYSFYQTFKNCYGLATISFPSLSSIESETSFSDMLSGCSNVTVVFPANLRSQMQNWSDVINGFGGTNTTVSFGETKTLPIYIDDPEYAVFINGTAVYDGDSYEFFVGSNTIIAYTVDHIGKYTFVVDVNTEEFLFDPSQIEYNCVSLSAEDINGNSISNVTYYAHATLDEVEVDLSGDNLYASTDTVLYIDASHNDYYFFSTNLIVEEPSEVILTGHRAATVIYTPENLLQQATYLPDSSAEQYFYIDSDTGQLVIHNEVDDTLECSIGIPIVLPENTTGECFIEGSVRVSSEKNYDYGYIAIGTDQILPTRQEAKAQTIPVGTGQYIFSQSGPDNPTTNLNEHIDDITQYSILTIGWAQDYYLKGTNSLYLDNLVFKFLLLE